MEDIMKSDVSEHILAVIYWKGIYENIELWLIKQAFSHKGSSRNVF